MIIYSDKNTMNNYLKLLLTIVLFITNHFSFAQYLLKNEKTIFSFTTENGKLVTVAKDATDAYLVYRFGTNDKTELKFPADKNESWREFEYSFYFRGGGEQNEGMDLNYLAFINGNFKYVIYDIYYSVDDKIQVGVKVINQESGETIDIKGDAATRIGSLFEFRSNELVETSDEMYD